MPGYGGLGPYPRVCGGGPNRLESILQSLNAGQGTAYDVTQSSKVYARNMATARGLDAAWATNQRLTNQWDPVKMTTLLSRQEGVYGMRPAATDLAVTRRANLALKFAAQGRNPTLDVVEDEIIRVLGTVFVAYETISPAAATIHVPDGTYPFGDVAAGAPWYSTVLQFLIKTACPAALNEGDFYAAVSRVGEVLDPLVPAWVTWEWYRAPSAGTPVSVSGGPSVGGFYLDDERNLDNNLFDV